MKGKEYKYYTQKDDVGYRFHLYPNNSNRQEIGRSERFPTEEACIKAMNEFRNAGLYFANHPERCEVVVQKEGKRSKYYFVFYDNDRARVFFRNAGYPTKSLCEKTLNQVILNIDSPYRGNKGEI